MNTSTTMAVAVVTALRSGEVTDVVLAPGSRSAALAIALHEADAAGLLRLHVRVDERSAAFLALGLAKGSHRPVAVVTTSGTAVAQLHPAVLEAAHAGEPVVVVSADRPAKLRGTGANQTSPYQVAVFGAAAPATDVAPDHPAEAAAAISRAVRRHGPSHINVQFAEPLLPETLPLGLAAIETDVDLDAADTDSARPEHGQSLRIPPGPRTVVVAGDDAGPSARWLAEEANWPLLAEPTSGARTGTHALRTYRLLLESGLGEQIERVVVTGHPTLSRPVTALLSRSDVEVIAVKGRSGVGTDPGRVARHVAVMPEPGGREDETWIDAWRAADRRLSKALDAVAAEAGDALPLQVAAEVAAAVTAGALLVVGSSQPVRDLDLMAPVYPAGQRRLVVGNRGLAGIDGMVSTAMGAALGRRSSRSLAYVGDVTFVHDLAGLVVGPDEPRPDLTIVVANDDGGAIFSTLEQGGTTYAGAFERVFATPHRVDLRAVCVATGTAYERADDAADLRDLLAADVAGVRVVEVPIPRRRRRMLADRLRAVVEPGGDG